MGAHRGLAGDEEGAGAVVDARGVAGGDEAGLLEDGRQLGEGLGGGAPAAGELVHGHHLGGLLAGHLDGDQLLLEAARVVGGLPRVLAAEGVGVALLAGDAKLGAELLGGAAHGQVDVAVVERRPQGVFQLEILWELGAVAHVAELPRSGEGAQTSRRGYTATIRA